MDWFFNIMWEDPKLLVPNMKGRVMKSIPPEISNHLWSPTISISHLKSTHVKQFNKPLTGFAICNRTGSKLWHEYLSTDVSINNWFSQTMAFWCDMNFDSFPFDTQVKFKVSLFSLKHQL